MDNNFENNNPFTEPNGNTEAQENAGEQPETEKAGNSFDTQMPYGQNAQNNPPRQNSVPPYTAYCDTNSGYMPYGYYPQKQEAVKKKSKNKKLGIAIEQ